MVTNIKLDLNDAERERIALAMTGKPGRLATRKQITEYIGKLMADDAKPVGATTIQTFICPKCNKPISLPVRK